jgi:hypothetical protein
VGLPLLSQLFIFINFILSIEDKHIDWQRLLKCISSWMIIIVYCYNSAIDLKGFGFYELVILLLMSLMCANGLMKIFKTTKMLNHKVLEIFPQNILFLSNLLHDTLLHLLTLSLLCMVNFDQIENSLYLNLFILIFTGLIFISLDKQIRIESTRKESSWIST